MGLNPNQARQAGGKFGFGKTAAKPQPTYSKASAIPVSAISPQLQAQARQILAQQAAAVKSQGKLTPAQRQYLRVLNVARGIIMRNQSALLKSERAQIAAAKKQAAAAKRAAAAVAHTKAVAAAAKARNPAAAAKGAAAGRQSRQGSKVTAPKPGASKTGSGKVMSNLQQYLAHP